jgi:hypothetical protein
MAKFIASERGNFGLFRATTKSTEGKDVDDKYVRRGRFGSVAWELQPEFHVAASAAALSALR